MLIIYSKENINFTKYRLFIFLIGLVIIIFSETTQKLIKDDLNYNLKIYIIRIIIFMLFYFSVSSKLKFKQQLKNKNS